MTPQIVICTFAFLALLTAQPIQAEGQLMVMPATTRVFNSHEQKVTVKNMGDSALYLAIELKKVTNPGIMPEIKVATGQLSHPTLLASPEKLTLGPNQSRTVVLKSLDEPTEEALYRLYIVPVRALNVTNAPANKISAPVSVAVGYGVLVRHMPAPAKQHSNWDYSCDAGGMTLTNTGNVRHLLSHVSMKGTPVAGAKNKKEELTVALFPGTPQHFNVQRMEVTDDQKVHVLSCPR